jgi:hypothetical protein
LPRGHLRIERLRLGYRTHLLGGSQVRCALITEPPRQTLVDPATQDLRLSLLGLEDDVPGRLVHGYAAEPECLEMGAELLVGDSSAAHVDRPDECDVTSHARNAIRLPLKSAPSGARTARTRSDTGSSRVRHSPAGSSAARALELSCRHGDSSGIGRTTRTWRLPAHNHLRIYGTRRAANRSWSSVMRSRRRTQAWL